MKTTLNHNRFIYLFLLILFSAVVSLSACDKFLEEKPSKNLRIVSSLADAQALLDYHPELNQRDLGAGEVSADDYYLSTENYNQIEENFQRMYTWEKDRLFAAEFNDWSNLYRGVYRANTALEVLLTNTRNSDNAQNWDNVRGQALFFRCWFYLQGLQIWSPAYRESSADTDLAIPLRDHTNFNIASSRPNLSTAYNQLEKDLKEAVSLLPVSQPGLTRPSKAAVTALIARLYLYKGDYSQAADYANQSINLHSALLDYNNLNPENEYPVPALNQEIIFKSYMYTPSPLFNSYAAIDSNLLESYHANDLRKSIFFKTNADGSLSFYGSYEGTGAPFTGISTAELYLTRAEATARLGNATEALRSLDPLLLKRYAKDPATGQSLYTPLQAANGEEAIQLILQERRKELIMRGLRWPDIKRLNRDHPQINLTRKLADRVVTLPANDLRYQLPIPEDIISIGDIIQNPR